MILNVANVKNFTNLETYLLKTAYDVGFSLDDILLLRLSSISKGGFKYEPVFVFKKTKP